MMTAAKISPPERKPSGDIKPKREEEAKGHPPTLVRRITDHAVALGIDRRMGTELGKLRLQGILTESEFEAGLRYAADVGAYERIMGHPRRSSESPSFEFGRKGADGLDLDVLRRMDPEAAEKLEKRIARKRKTIKNRYDRAQECIPERPLIARIIIDDLCCNDRWVESVHHDGIKAVLRTLAAKCYRLNLMVEQDNKPKKKKNRRADAKDLAEGA